MADSKRRLGIIGGVALLAAAGASIAGLLVVRAQRAEYVQETLALLGEAKKVHARGEFDESVRLSSAAVKRLQENGGWFETAQSREVQESDALLRKHQGLWNETSQSAALAATDPGEARRRLEAIAARAEAEGERGRPIQARVRPAIEQALAAEREHVRKRVEAVSAAARKHYEGHAFAEFADSVRAIRTAVESLPSASRDGLAAPADLAAFAQVLGEAESAAHESEEDWVKADKVRDLLARVPNPKEAGVHLRQALIERIAALDKETRAPVKTLKIPEASQKKLVEAFTRWGGDVEFIPGVGDLSDGFELQSTRHRYFVRMIGPQPRVLIEADRVRIVFDVDLVNGREGFALESAGAMARGMRATRHERVFAESSWVVVPDAPGPCAVQTEGDRAWIYLEGRVYDGDVKGQDPDTNSKVGTFLSRARLLEATVRNSDGVPEALRGPVVALLRAAHTPAAPHDYLDGQFCREAIHGGYLEGHLPKIDESVVDRLKGYRDSYDEILRWRARMTGSNKEGGRVESTSNLEGDGLWRLFDPAGPATTFALSPRDPMGTRLVVHTTFEGKHDLWPEAAEPIRVLMFHPAAGEIARWEAATGKLTFDAERWARALRTDEPQGISDHFGKAEWRVPPHVVRVDSRGRPQALILPNGTLRAAPFAPGPARRDAQEKFLDDCARLLRTPGELHLFYRYFVQYVLDSPVTTAVTLIGSSRHTGEVHQDAYQTLDRWVAGRLLADCDDLAEFYQTVLKRQGRLAYVLGVPGHATCGLIEKEGDEWVFFCVDTGPPRQLRDKDLDMVLERLLLTYDDEGDMSFDPRSVRFMFRFAGEQTRSDYYLDSRMFRDREYAEIMIRVQEFWHFSFYALGIETMGKMLETDKMPANCAEIAGLFMRVGQYEHAIRWTETGVAGLDPKDPLSRLNESMRKALCLRELKRTGDAVQVLKASAAELAAIQRDKPDESHRYRRLRFEIATSLAE
ncbi:MAG TPA: hypothetical protein VI643_07585, partial [Planctomycetota bacterium]|nr:hypothetical protein [Planctomycetota bacterium]